MAFTIEKPDFALRPAEQMQISLGVAAGKLASHLLSHRKAES